ncbi:MAG: sigma factor [Cyanobacteriota bacterium]|jgi:DNA-directed RNA polymerase specialized sigma subunit
MPHTSAEVTQTPSHRPSARQHQSTSSRGPARVSGASRRRPHRCDHPHAAANALALQHQDIARAVAANLSRRTGHAREDLEQIAMVGIILAARRYAPERGSFRPFARRYANGEVHHFLRDRGFLIKVPPSWRELHARGRKLQSCGVPREAVAQRLGVNQSRWEEIELACSVGVVPLGEVEVG